MKMNVSQSRRVGGLSEEVQVVRGWADMQFEIDKRYRQSHLHGFSSVCLLFPSSLTFLALSLRYSLISFRSLV
jgi:hypothetical protein